MIRRLLVSKRLKQVRLLVCDVDGVLTDGGLHYDESGRVVKRFDVRDGLGIRMLQRAGIEVAFLSGGRSGAIEQRARHLDIRHCLVGVGDKLAALQDLLDQLDLGPEHTAFIGDDLNDLTVRPAVGLLVSPANGARGLRRQADLVLRQKGGDGAVRELAERLLHQRGHWQTLSREGWRDTNS
ncbi:MAG: phosphatase [Synechococcaceae bacterium WB9_2_170]|nr:phosphatase [Synechococcaceae bacterium WB9_2_170]